MIPSPSTTVITGASSGIGAATARLLAGRGHRIVLMGRNHDTLSNLIEELPVADGAHHAVVCDVADPDQVSEAVAALSEIVGAPDGLINAAGICIPAALDTVTPATWMATIQTNLTGTFLVAQAIAHLMKTARVAGSILNLGSEASLIGMPHYTAYCASKAGVIGLTRAMAAELAPHNIRVNALCPGPVDTPMLRAELALTGDPNAAWDAELARVPLRRVATADEIAESAAWLLGAQNATGTVLSLDGGTTGAFNGAGAAAS